MNSVLTESAAPHVTPRTPVTGCCAGGEHARPAVLRRLRAGTRGDRLHDARGGRGTPPGTRRATCRRPGEIEDRDVAIASP